MKRTYGENKEIGINVTSRLPDSLIKRADEYRIKNNIESRSGLIGEALEAYITSQKCPKCGAHNPANGTRCSVCGENIGKIKGLIDEAEDLLKKIGDISPQVKQKYNLCYTSINALKIEDIFLLRRFDLITAELIIDETEGDILDNNVQSHSKIDHLMDKRRYFIGPPEFEKFVFTIDFKTDCIDYNIATEYILSSFRKSIDNIKGDTWIDSKSGISNTNTSGEKYYTGGDRLTILTRINHLLGEILINYRRISLELDQISEYLTVKGKELEASKEDKKADPYTTVGDLSKK